MWLAWEKVERIRALAAEGKGLRAIARETGCHTDTVQRYLPKNAETAEKDYERWRKNVGRKAKERGRG